MINIDTALGKQFLEVAKRQPAPQIPADRQHVTSGGNQKPANADR